MTSDEDEIDDGYERLLAEIGRSEEEDQSVACHEAAHCLAWLLLNSDASRKIAGVTITPGDTYEGRVWGERQIKTFARDIDASDVRGVLEPLMPGAGGDRANIADVFSSVYHQCLEYVSGRIGEEMFDDGATSGAADDYRQARELAALFCKSPPGCRVIHQTLRGRRARSLGAVLVRVDRVECGFEDQKGIDGG
jgi:hypothetical protein